MLCVSAFAQAQKNNEWGVKSYGEKAIASASRKAPPKLPVLKPKFDFVEYQSTPEDPKLKETYATQPKKERYTRKKEKTEKETIASNKPAKTKKEKGKEKPKEYMTDRDGNPETLLEEDYVNTSKSKNTSANTSTKTESALFLKQTKSLVDSARTFSGVPYRVGGTDKNGVDCSGLVVVVYKNIGKSLPRRSIDMSNYGTQVFDMKDIKAGDLLFFDSSNGTKINHVGMVTGVTADGKITFIHATNKGVMEESLMGKYWSVRHRKTMRVLDDKASSRQAEKFKVHASN